MITCIYCGRKGTRGFSAVHSRDEDYVDQWRCVSETACEKRQTLIAPRSGMRWKAANPAISVTLKPEAVEQFMQQEARRTRARRRHRQLTGRNDTR